MTLNPQHKSWLVDSGATDHIGSDFALLTNPQNMSSNLYLPDGSMILITHIWDVYITDDLILLIKTVYAFISLSFNLCL